jgi:uroporphyrinogen III methyltransferase/synthase
VARAGSYDWIVLTSPSAVRCFIEVLGRTGLDTRTLPKIVVCGPGTARELKKHHLVPDAAPASDFGAGGLTELAGSLFRKGDKVLRLRSEKAGTDLYDFFRKSGLQAEDCILYRNEPISYDSLPQFDAVFFASSSAVDVFVSQWGKDALKSKTVAAIGKPTEKTLSEHGINADVVGREATVQSAIAALAEKKLKESLEKIL